MKQKMLKIVVSIGLIITLIGINFFAVGKSIAIAIYENLESQPIQISNTNIEFDAYFKEGEAKKHSKSISIINGDNLYFKLKINNTGVLNNAKITINEPNFEIASNIENQYIKSIEGNSINLNQIIYGNDIEIEIPIKFKKQEQINLNYFDKETTISLEGEYKDQDENARSVKGEITIATMWSDEPQINLTQEIEKYFALSNGNILLQQKIDIEVANNILPIKNEKITTQAPVIENEIPEIQAIINNGTKLEESQYSYDKQTGTLIITKSNEPNSENIINWGTGKDTYKIIYNYTQKQEINRTIKTATNLEIALYTKDAQTKQDEKEIQITKTGNIITAQNQITENTYKGYLYAGKGNETTYTEDLNLEISNTEEIENIQIDTQQNNFVTEQNIKNSTNGSTYYKSVQFNKEQISRILGEEGNIQITTQNNENIAQIDSNTKTDEKGNIIIPIDNIEKISIKTTKPVEEGNIEIKLQKAIKSETGYTKEQIKTFTKLESITNITAKDTQQSTANMNLIDTVPEATIEVNKTNFSTLEENQNVQIIATLKSNSSKHDLYKNPYIEIQLPSEVEEIDVTSIQKIYADEFKVEMARYNKAENKIEIQLSGEQNEFKNDVNQGIQIIIDANIKINKTTPTKESAIILRYRNENRNNEQNETQINIQISSKYGVLLYNSLNNYNEQNEKVETTTEQVAKAKLDTNASAKQANMNTTVINNYDKEIKNISLVGKISKIGQNTNNEISTIDTSLAQTIQTNNPEAKIYYSTQETQANSNQWQENIENLADVKMIKVEIPTLKPGETLNTNYKINIPENIEVNEKGFQITNLNYTYNEQNIEEYSTIQLATEELIGNTPVTAQENLEGLEVKIQTSTAGRELEQGEEVFEGQTIKNVITITNNTGKDLNNFKLIGNQKDAQGNKNVTFFNNKKVTIPDEATGEPVQITKYQEDEDLNEKTIIANIFKNGETLIFTYEYTVNQIKTENEVTIGTITLQADDFETSKQITENKIKEAELKLITEYAKNEEVPFSAGYENGFVYKITNISDKNLNDITINIPLLDGVTLAESSIVDGENYKIEEITEDNLKIRITQLTPGQTEEILKFLNVPEIDKDKAQQAFQFSCNAQINENQYYSNILIKEDVNEIAQIELEQKSNIVNSYVTEKDEIEFITTIKNTSIVDADLTIEEYLNKTIQVKEAYLEADGKKVADMKIDQQEDYDDNQYLSVEYSLKAKQEVNLVIRGIVGTTRYQDEELESCVTAIGGNQYAESNTLTYEIREYEEEPTVINPDEPENPDPEDPDNPDPDDPNPPITPQTYANISGKAWIDTNKNGIKDEETSMSGIEVILLDGKTGETIKDENGNDVKTTTGQNGEYRFEHIKSGSYIVGFKYDTSKYSVTQYQVLGISNSQNSDVISKNVTIEGQEQIIALTNEIILEDEDIENIDAGFYENQIFDISLQKTINKLVVQTSKSTQVTEYSGATLAKADIRAKEANGATVIIEYNIRVTNEGEIPAKVNDIVDYIPEDLTFSSELNKNWYLSTDGTLHTTELANTQINPGESKDITLTLMKSMSENNFGTTVNSAEIQSATNNLGIGDKDSTPANKVDSEDDYGTAEVIISVHTGGVIIAISITAVLIVIMTIAGIVIYKIKRKEG